MNAQEIEVHVEELLLHGVPASHAGGVAEQIERELARLLGRSVIAADTSARRLDAGSFELGREPVAHAIGTRVARSVQRSLAL